jgi:hypothetical protein
MNSAHLLGRAENSRRQGREGKWLAATWEVKGESVYEEIKPGSLLPGDIRGLISDI